MYTVGRQAVPLHVLCGVWWEILKPDGTRLCLIAGDKQKTQEVVDLLNYGSEGTTTGRFPAGIRVNIPKEGKNADKKGS